MYKLMLLSQADGSQENKKFEENQETRNATFLLKVSKH
jgi:hypothetical protein